MTKRLLSTLALVLCLAPTSSWATDPFAQGGLLTTDVAPAAQALGALNAVCTIAVQGRKGVGFQLSAGTLIGTIVPEISFDNGTTWNASFFDDPTAGNHVASVVFGSANTATARTIVGAGGASNVRVRVSAFTSGTANCAIRASMLDDPSLLSAGAAGAAVPPTALQVGGKDGSGNLQPIQITAKGTQPATGGEAVQDLKDSGRSQILLVWERVAGTANVESTLTNFTVGSKAAANITPATSYTVTAAKTLRIQQVNVSLTSTSTVVNNARVRIRQAASGITNASQMIFDYDIPWPIGGTVAANLGTSISIPIPDGLEVAAGQQVTVTWITAAATCTVTVGIVGFEY